MARVIINADDFGLSKKSNDAIAYCFEKQLIDRASIMINMPYADDAIAVAKKNGFLDKIGLHLNLSFGYPVSDSSESKFLCNEEGKFNAKLLGKWSYLALSNDEKKAITAEAEAQMIKFLSCGCTAMHMDSHRHIHTRIPIFHCIEPLLKKYEFESVRISRNIGAGSEMFAKKVYKNILNRFLLNNFNAQHEDAVMYTYMGSYRDFFESNGTHLCGVAEIMIHPEFDDLGRLFDRAESCDYDLEKHLITLKQKKD